MTHAKRIAAALRRIANSPESVTCRHETILQSAEAIELLEKERIESQVTAVVWFAAFHGRADYLRVATVEFGYCLSPDDFDGDAARVEALRRFAEEAAIEMRIRGIKGEPAETCDRAMQALIEQRDDARRCACHLHAWNKVGATAGPGEFTAIKRRYATERGWDCYAEEAK